MKKYYVYILLYSDKEIYTGYSEGIEERLSRHQRGDFPATKNRRPISLVCFFTFFEKYKALEIEKYLKSGSGRAFIKKHII